MIGPSGQVGLGSMSDSDRGLGKETEMQRQIAQLRGLNDQLMENNALTSRLLARISGNDSCEASSEPPENYPVGAMNELSVEVQRANDTASVTRELLLNLGNYF